MKSHSLANINKTELKKMCEDLIQRVNLERDKRDKAMKQRLLDEKNSNWFRKLFKKKELTLDDITDDDLIDRFPWSYPSTYAWGSLDVAQKLLNAADKTCTENVMVSAEDLSFL